MRHVALASMWAVAVVGVLLGTGPGNVEAQLPWDTTRWEVQAQESRVETYLGREALYLQGGTAWLREVELRDGVVEFDVAATEAQGFHGVRFRAVDRLNHEHIYLRPHLSEKSDAVQYNPIYNGVSGWQLYSDARYALPVRITPDRWVHVRLAVQGRRAEMTVDGALLVFPELVRDPVSGRVGLNSSAAAARFANVVVRPGADPGFGADEGAPAVEPEPGTVLSWLISQPFSEDEVDGVTDLPSDLNGDGAWEPLEADVRGIANIAKLHGNRSEDRNTVFAAITLRSDGERVLRVRVGFSDRLRAFLNGRQLYAGADEYATRDYRFLGTIGLFDELFLPLRAGENRLWLAVSEDFGGWGVTMQIPDVEGIEISEPRSSRLSPPGAGPAEVRGGRAPGSTP